jgi:hypothetical protein
MARRRTAVYGVDRPGNIDQATSIRGSPTAGHRIRRNRDRRPITVLQVRVAGRKRQILGAAALLLGGLAVLAVLLVTVWFIFVIQVMSYE